MIVFCRGEWEKLSSYLPIIIPAISIRGNDFWNEKVVVRLVALNRGFKQPFNGNLPH